MKKNLLKLFVLLLAVLGAMDTWADGITPTLDVMFRTKLSDNTYSWNDNAYPKTASETNNTFSANHRPGMFVLQKYTVENLAAVKQIVLTLKGPKDKGTDAFAFWAYTDNEWSASSTAATLSSKVNEIVGLPLNKTKSADDSYTINTPLIDGSTTSKSTEGEVTTCTFTFKDDALAKLKKSATNNTFTLLITNKTGDMTNASSQDRQFYSSGNATESYRPAITVTYDAVGVEYADGTKTNYSSFNDAYTKVKEGAQDATMIVMEDQNITARVNAFSSKVLTIVAGKDNVTLTNTQSNSLAFLTNASNLGTINIGSADHKLIVKNNAETTNSVVEASGNSEGANINIENVTFSGIASSNTSGLIKTNDSKAKVSLKDVIFENCSVTAENAGVVYCSADGVITLKGNMSFTGCAGNCFKLKGRMEEDGFTPNDVMTVYSDGIKLGKSAVIKMNAVNRDKYVLVNEDRCLVGKGNATNEELVVSEAYTLSVSAANAATLIIPFATTIPEGVTAYTLNYTSGQSKVKATAVETTLNANTPVLINATGSAEGTKYKFNASTKASGDTAASTDVDEVSRTSGALVGVYTSTTVPNDCYILSVKNSNVGFYKADGSTNKVGPYRAYLKADGAGAALSIVYGDDDETTAIETLNIEHGTLNVDAPMYNLAGQRVGRDYKGIVIVNGKKIVRK